MTVDGYLEGLPENQRKALRALQQQIKTLVPHAEETISYGMPAFKQNGIIVYYAAFTNHMSLFVMPAVLNQVRALIPGRSTTKSAIHFTETNPIPAAVVEGAKRNVVSDPAIRRMYQCAVTALAALGVIARYIGIFACPKYRITF